MNQQISSTRPVPVVPPEPIAVTMGEPAGIGGEIALQAYVQARTKHPSPAATPYWFLIDAPTRLSRLATALKISCEIIEIQDPSEARDAWQVGLPVLPLPMPVEAVLGTPNAKNATAVLQSIETALDLVLSGTAAAMVTNPINKEVLIAAGFEHSGHTDMLADRAQAMRPGSVPRGPVMLMATPELRVVPVTIHMSLRDAASSLSRQAIVDCSHVLHQALQSFFDIKAPKIAVAGLNPHAGEGGIFGDEETTTIAPAIAELNDAGLTVIGPLAADTLFAPTNRRLYDAIICMYHDQALIPIKTLDFAHCVNATLGLPFVRTSPAHGTGFDIAGTGRADPTSFASAINLASQMAASLRAASTVVRRS